MTLAHFMTQSQRLTSAKRMEIFLIALFFAGCFPPRLEPPFCGDNVVQPELGEECDAGDQNSPNRVCTLTCKVAFCGDGLFLDGAEECDNGPLNGDSAACTPECREARCGDGFVYEAIEECDRGSLNADNASCTSRCKVAFCGDGLVHEGVEDCDDGPSNGTGACSETCTVAPECGDGLLFPALEDCDDGNRFGGDGCSPDCRLPRTVLLSAATSRIIGGLSEGNYTPAEVGDVNGDGVGDLLVGDYAFPALKVRLFNGPLQGDLTFADADEVFDGFHDRRVPSALGDLNNDGVDDFFYRDLGGEASAVQVVYGAASNAFTSAELTHDAFLQTVVGFSNGNARSLVVSEPDSGTTFVVGPWTGTATLDSLDATEIRGSSNEFAIVRGTGDLTGDDQDDVLIAATENSDSAGAIYVVSGPVNTDVNLSNAQAVLRGAGDGWEIGDALAVGELTGDGVLDLVVGGVGGGGFPDRTWVVSGPLSGDLTLGNVATIDRDEVLNLTVGDVNQDGIDDLLVGNYTIPVNGISSGQIHLIYGPIQGSLDLELADITFEGEAQFRVGDERLVITDVDGDQQGDVIFTSKDVNGVPGNEGTVYVFSGASL